MPAWHEFFRRYDALLDQWCQRQSLDAAAADEIRETIWIELAHRMRTFRYDPRKSFRGWLRVLCQNRAVDFRRSRKRESWQFRSLDGIDPKVFIADSDSLGSSDDEFETGHPMFEDLRGEAEAVQAAVRKRVNSRTWDVFWQIDIMERPIREIAAEYGMTYAAAFAAYDRTRRILREEGERSRGSPAGT